MEVLNMNLTKQLQKYQPEESHKSNHHHLSKMTIESKPISNIKGNEKFYVMSDHSMTFNDTIPEYDTIDRLEEESTQQDASLPKNVLNGLKTELMAMKLKKPDEPDFRYKENRIRGYNKDGTLDLRCKENRMNV